MTERVVIVGAADECHLRVRSPLVSAKHCSITEVMGTDGPLYYVEDLGSTNGTYLVREDSHGINWDVRTVGPSRVRIRPGYQIRVARTTLPWKG